MTYFDYTVLVIIGLSILLSVMRGLVQEVLALGAWVLSFWLASNYAGPGMAWMPAGLPNDGIRYLAAFLAIFCAVWLATAIVRITLNQFLQATGLKPLDRLLGAGFGLALIIFAGIVAGLPGAIGGTLELARTGELHTLTVFLLLAVILVVTGFVVFVERGQRRITVNYAKRQVGRKMYAGQTSHLPLKVNMSGVIPPIFASSIILFPSSVASWFGSGDGFGWLKDLAGTLSPGQPLYVLIYTIAIAFFAFFYTALVFNPKETAENLKKSGAFIPGIRPGDQTARYVDGVMSRLTLAGAIYLVAVCLLPEFMILNWNVPFYFGGTSLLIVVVVVMDFMAQVQAHLMSHQYEGLLKKANLRGFGRVGAPR